MNINLDHGLVQIAILLHLTKRVENTFKDYAIVFYILE